MCAIGSPAIPDKHASREETEEVLCARGGLWCRNHVGVGVAEKALHHELFLVEALDVDELKFGRVSGIGDAISAARAERTADLRLERDREFEGFPVCEEHARRIGGNVLGKDRLWIKRILPSSFTCI